MSDILEGQVEPFVLRDAAEVDQLLAKLADPDCSDERRVELVRVLADTCKAEMEFNAECGQDMDIYGDLISYALRTINARNPIAKPQDIALLGRLRKRFPFFVASSEVPR